jgi:hypothetical protein
MKETRITFQATDGMDNDDECFSVADRDNDDVFVSNLKIVPSSAKSCVGSKVDYFGQIMDLSK